MDGHWITIRGLTPSELIVRAIVFDLIELETNSNYICLSLSIFLYSHRTVFCYVVLFCVCLPTVCPNCINKGPLFKKKKPGMWNEKIGHLDIRGRSLSPASPCTHGPARQLCIALSVNSVGISNVLNYSRLVSISTLITSVILTLVLQRYNNY
jgi:hypothetical protein